MTSSELQTVNDRKVDISLLMKRLQELILSGKDEERGRSILHKKYIWSSLSLDRSLQWARLAQAAGENELSLEILEWLNSKYPENREAWREHYQLLQFLSRDQQAARVRARALSMVPQMAGEMNQAAVVDDQGNEPVSVSDDPFWEHHRQQKLLEIYLKLFQGREDCFARQWSDKKADKQGYVPVRRPLEIEDVREHIAGRKTYGIYLLNQSSQVSTAVVDMDLDKNLLETKGLAASKKDLLRRERDYLLERIPEESRRLGLECLTEFSGRKGYHFWYFFSPPVDAGLARGALQKITKKLGRDISCFKLEVFPKQDRLSGKGFGNLVKLPLGIHRHSGKKSYFLSSKGTNVWDNMGILEKVKTNSFEETGQSSEQQESSSISVHPRYEQWASKYPELAMFIDKCPPLGQIILNCRRHKELGMREEKIIFATLGFLKRSKTLVHALFQELPDYNQHLVDYRLSRVRGTPLGCKKIHALMSMNIDYCAFEYTDGYLHPLLHCPQWTASAVPKSEKVENLQQALEQLQNSLDTVKRFLPDSSRVPEISS
ncbi:DNA primase small subunit [Desulfonatronospira thiodismutans ASO3-1]|uniref:DNA primase small subunit n=1 Tax=Desulfonatronospira thiodismutans ASO3-1 TaxID=555779 RepID=D6SPU5_9BACT|nr:CRISPR-associated primase-polymerase type A1 [Desulfonatronospira thiodismutans]EFI34771.1 DNA primase small subunit [Desulfonatronospira thiodismutans ASO3-1]